MIKLPRLPSPSKMSSRERLLAAGVVFAVCVLLLDRVVLGPWWRHVHQVRQEIHRLENTLRISQRLIEHKPQITAQMQAYSTYLVDAEGESKDTAALLREIETMGKESGSSLGEVKPLASQQTGTLQEDAFEVSYTGSFRQWIHFVYLIQTSKTLFQIDRATLGRKDETSELLAGSLKLTRRAIAPQEASPPPQPGSKP